jgi:hypothetical protein
MVLKKELVARWVAANPPVQKWLQQLAPSSQAAAVPRAYAYFQWLYVHGGPCAGLSVAALLDLQDQQVGRARYAQLDVLQRYVNGLSQRVSSKTQVYSTIRSVYARNRVELPRDRCFVIRSDIAPPTREPFTVEGLRRLIGVASRLYRAVFLCMFQGALGNEELMVLNRSWDQVWPQLLAGRSRVKIALPGRKHSRNRMPYYTFIGHDAVVALKAYLDAERGAVPKAGPLFVNR